MSFNYSFGKGNVENGRIASWFNDHAGETLVPKSEAEHKKDKSFIGSVAALFFLICTIIGVLIISWYSGSSGASLDSSFGNHCLAATEGSSAEGGASASSFDVSFNSSNFDETKVACKDRPRTESFQSRPCANRRLGNRGTGYGGIGAANEIQGHADVVADEARAAGVAYYRPRNSPTQKSNKRPDYTQFSDKLSSSEQQKKDMLSKMKNDRVSKMNNLANAPSSVTNRLIAGREGFLQMAKSSNLSNSSREDYIASGAMLSAFVACGDEATPDYPAAYVGA